MPEHRIFRTAFARVYPLYVEKAERKNRTKEEVHPNSSLIKGVVCGVRVEEIDDPLMRKIRCLDKLIDELARGKSMAKILRQ